MQLSIIQEEYERPELVERILNGISELTPPTYNLMLIRKSGEIFTARTIPRAETRTFINFHEALLFISAPEITGLKLRKQLNEIKQILEEKTTRVIETLEPTERQRETPNFYYSFNKYKEDEERRITAERAIKYIRLLRPKTVEFGEFERFAYTISDSIWGWWNSEEVKRITASKILYCFPICNTPVMRISYGISNSRKYGSNVEFIYCKI